ncbi:MAG: hypothetical protein ACQEQE_07785 [Bacillota bacterium]
MENSLKMLMIGAAVAITLAIITAGFYILRQGQGIMKSSSEKVSQISSEIEESEFTIYENQEVSGSEVVNLVRKYRDDRVGIYIETGKDTNGTWYNNEIDGVDSDDEVYVGSIESENGESLSTLLDEENDEYVNPNGRFLGRVVRNENDSIIGLYFEQE